MTNFKFKTKVKKIKTSELEEYDFDLDVSYSDFLSGAIYIAAIVMPIVERFFT